MNLPEMIAGLQQLLERKDQLEAATKETNAKIEAAKAEIAQQMIDDDMPEVTYREFSFKLTQKTKYSKRSDADLAEAGVDFFDVLREEGLGDIIKETVNAQTLQATVNAYIEENGELSEALGNVINVYEYTDIVRRRKPGARSGSKTAGMSAGAPGA